MKPEATSSQAGEVTQLAVFPWRFLPSMLSELVHYRHHVLSARVITFVTLTQLGFMLHAFMHSRSIFLGACTCYHMSWIPMLFPPALCDFYWSALSEYPFWYIHSRIGHISSVFSFRSVSSLWFLCRCILNVSLLEHLYLHSLHWNSWSFSFFWWTFMISEQMYFQIFLFTIFVFTLGTPMLVLSLNLNLNMVLPQGTNR